MALSYPLTPPSTPAPQRLGASADNVVASNVSPFTRYEQVYAWPGDQWGPFAVALPPLDDEDARAWLGFLLGLNGIEGSFLMGDPGYGGKVGTWAFGSPTAVVNGAHAAGVRTVALKHFTAGATAKAGDLIQFGSGSGSRLHRVVQDAVADAGGALTLEIFPRVRAALADGDGFVLDNPVGIWRLADNRRDWSVEEMRDHGISFGMVELLRD